MLYYSPEYIFLFLPITIIIYFFSQRFIGATFAKITLIIASLVFYGIWNLSNVPVLMTSVVMNYIFVRALTSPAIHTHRKKILIVGLGFNLSLLMCFKYTNFAIENINRLGGHFDPVNLILPLGISFFTFQKIALLVDVYQNKVQRPSLLNFALFVSFFPQLIAGPIVHHTDVMWQFAEKAKLKFNVVNFTNGVVLFIIGLVKKLLLADYMAIYANTGFAPAYVENIGLIDAWVAAISYTFQLYFDFSGYIDMGIGSALMFNIVLPQNFLSPYKSVNIQEFWRRWHITLGRFLRDYIYIPLGGAKHANALRNIMITFLIGGIWHGAAWTFVVWGLYHGTGLCVNRLVQRSRFRIPRPLGILLTFWFVVCGWVFFRAASLSDALIILTMMYNPFDLNSAYKSAVLWKWLATALVCLGICWGLPNSHAIITRYRPKMWHIPILCAAVMAAAVFAVYINAPQPFLYFNF